MPLEPDAPDILDLTFDEGPSISSQVKSLLPTIAHYRDSGRSLRKIHTALVEGGHISCQWRTFEKTYYRIRPQSPPSVQSPKPSPLPAAADRPTKPRNIREVMETFDLEKHQAIARAEFARHAK